MARQRRIPRTRDPMSTKRIERDYERRLSGRVRAFGTAAKDIIKGDAPRMLEIKKLPPSYFDRMDQMAAYLIARQGQTIAAEELVKAFYNGQEYAQAAGKVTGVIPVTETLNIQMVFGLPPNRDTMEILNRRNYDLIKGLSEDQAKRVKFELTEGMIAGEDMDRLAKRIDAVTDIGISRAQTIARTETQTAAVQGAKNLYEQWGVDQVEWIAAIDDRTCTTLRIEAGDGRTFLGCGDVDGKTFDIDKAPKCPAHPNCRCALAPYNPVPGEKKLEAKSPELIVGPEFPIDAAEGSIWIDGPVRIRL
jgi:SPP1 gp7 family putative phage head morphogenesis protein